MKQKMKLLFGVLLSFALMFVDVPWPRFTMVVNAQDKTLSGTENYEAGDGDVMTGSTSGTVTIADNASVTLSNVTITGGIVCAGSAEIILTGTNSVSGATNKAGIQIGGSGTTLTIKGDGSLTANGNTYSAGIGLSRAWDVDADGGNIVIEGGNITANGGSQWGAGIGTGVVYGDGSAKTVQIGNITIKGGSVTATGGSEADGIGTGYAYSGCTNAIGTVTIYDAIDIVDASSIKDFSSVVYMHDNDDVTGSKTVYFTISEDGNHRTIVPKDDTDYNIIYDDSLEHGVVTGQATAKYLDNVTIEATPAAGYWLKKLIVKDSNNNEVATTGNSFVMPNRNVSVSAEFVEFSSYADFIPTSDDDADTLGWKAVRFNNYDWYIIENGEGTLTLLAKDPIGRRGFNNSVNEGNHYSTSKVKAYLDSLTAENGSFAEVADAIKTITVTTNEFSSKHPGYGYAIYDTAENVRLYLLSTKEALNLPDNIRKCSEAEGSGGNNWWLRSPGDLSNRAAYVNGGDGYVVNHGDLVELTLGVRPALKLNLSSVIFSSESKTFLLRQTISADDVTTTYGDTDKSVSASVTGPATGGGSISYAVKSGSEDYISVNATTGALTIKNVPTDGKAYVTVTAAASGIYGVTTKDVTVTIGKATPVVTAPTANTLTYNGNEQELVTAGSATFGTLLYSLDGTDYSTDIPTATDVGTYTVYYMVEGSDNWNAVEAQSLEVAISEIPSIPQFKSHTLLLSGQIGVNFYMDLSMLTNEEKAAAVMEFTVNGKKTTDTFDAGCTNPSTHTYYGFTCYINAAQMADEITATLKYGENQTVSQTYSIAEYVSYVNAHPDGYSNNAIALVNAIADYGHYVQPFLETSNNWTLGTDHAVMSAHSVYTDSDVQAARTAVSGKAIIRDTGDSMVDKVTYSLSLESETTLNIYLEMKEGYTGAVTASIGGNAVDAVLQTDGRYRIQIKNISADDLSDTYEIEISAGGNFTVSVSALSYVNTVLNSDSDTFNNTTAHYAVTSIYRYYVATMNYAEHPND